MDKQNWEPDHNKSNPEKAYREELHNEGSSLTDSPAESEARDKAKIEKVLTGQGQKMDTVAPDELQQDDISDEEIRRETLEKE